MAVKRTIYEARDANEITLLAGERHEVYDLIVEQFSTVTLFVGGTGIPKESLSCAVLADVAENSFQVTLTPQDSVLGQMAPTFPTYYAIYDVSGVETIWLVVENDDATDSFTGLVILHGTE